MDVNNQNRRFFLSSSLVVKALAVFFLWLGLAACATPQQGSVQQAVAIAPGGEIGLAATAVFTPIPPTPTSTPPPTLTPTPTQTPTPTPTPTATAVSILSQGDPRQMRLQDPIPQSGASCGLVDILDFPLSPPDAETITSGGRDFGVFRQRYDSYHAGEDWWVARGEGNFGLPVHSIGHGIVTYAEPLGWGRDQGIVIVRHVLTNGQTFLSFYGHLDPPSITLRAGQCVTRGQKVGEIGRPRTPPHLHFEIRTHLPTAPGGGYWDIDPTQGGWLPPSQTIWEQRNTQAAGVVWHWPTSANGRTSLGALDDLTYLLIEDEGIVAVSLADGRVQWRLTDEAPILHAIIDRAGQQMITAGPLGELAAYGLARDGAGVSRPDTTPLWRQNLDLVGQPKLVPIPDGGVMLTVRQRLIALAADGRLLWEEQLPSAPLDWLRVDGQLLLTSSGRNGALWSVTAEGVTPWAGVGNGRLFTHANEVFLYANDGLYQLDLNRQTVVLWYPLPPLFGSGSGIASLPDGSLLLLHSDTRDRRLLMLNSDGTLRWERSLRRAVPGELALLTAGEQVFLTALDTSSANNDLRIYGINLAQPALTHLYTGGTRQRSFSGSWAQGTDAGLLLIQVGGGNLVALDALAAETAVLKR